MYRAPTLCQSLSATPTTSSRPTQQAGGGVLAPRSCCSPPATVTGLAQGVLIPGGQNIEETIPTALQGQLHSSQCVGGRRDLNPPPAPAGCPGWGLHFSSMSQSPEIGDLGPGQHTAAGPRPADQEPENMSLASLPGTTVLPSAWQLGAGLAAQAVSRGSPTRTSRGEGSWVGPGQEGDSRRPGAVDCRPSQVSWPLPS